MSIRFLSALITFLFGFTNLFAQNTFMGGDILYSLKFSSASNGKFIYRNGNLTNCTKNGASCLSFIGFNMPILNPTSFPFYQSSYAYNNTCFAPCLGSLPPRYLDGIFLERVMFNNPDSIFCPYPPTNIGWVFSSNSCASILKRDLNLKNILRDTINTSRNNGLVWTRIYPFPPNSYPFVDHSVEFSNIAACFANSGQFMVYNPGAIDLDGDSIVAVWNHHIHGRGAVDFANPGSINNTWPLGGLPNPTPSSGHPYSFDSVTYAAGYAYNKPLPDTSFHPGNIPAQLNPKTGEITFRCYNPGLYSANVGFRSYRNGYLLSEVNREILFTIFPATSNSAPQFAALNNSFSDTVWAGDSVSIPFLVSDNSATQWLRFSATGYLLDSTLSGTTHCPNPPCARFTPLAADSFHSPLISQFKWQTACNHLGQAANNSITYSFILQAIDNYCPVRAQATQSIHITILRPPKIAAVQNLCIKNDSLVGIRLQWTPATDSSQRSFKKYLVYQSDNLSGPYVLIDSLFGIQQSSYYHTNAVNDTLFYFVQTVSGCDNVYNQNSDTLSNLFLQMHNSGFGISTLEWNMPIHPDSGSYVYCIQRSINSGAWHNLDSTQNLIYTDTVSVCSLSVAYRIVLQLPTSCRIYSNEVNDVFNDQIAPQFVLFDTVSVDALHHSQLAWSKGMSPDTRGYYIYDGVGNILDTIWDPTQIYYTHLPSNASVQSYCYRIAAFDSCGNISTKTDVHCTAFLRTKISRCDKKIVLNWQPNQDSLSLMQEIWFSENSGPYLLLTTLGNGLSSYIHQGATPNSVYCYKVVNKLSNNRSSSSNTICLTADFNPPIAYTYLRLVSIQDNGQAELRILSDTSVAVKHYIVERSLSNQNQFVELVKLPFIGNPELYFTDTELKSSQSSYTYRIISVDSCDAPDTSNPAKSIYLWVEEKNASSNLLHWNDYGDWQAGTSYYLIHRFVGQNPILPPIVQPYSSSVENLYLDDLSGFAMDENSFSYRIEAIENIGNPLTLSTDSSRSNRVQVEKEPLIFVPNAFHPGGVHNPVFKPVIPYSKNSEYHFEIFNRWGEKIFESSDINQGWDGTYQGKASPEDAYVYQIQFKTFSGKQYIKRGSVILVR